MNKVKIFAALILTASFFGCQIKNTTKRVQQKTAEKPNIIFIMSDDHAYQAISAYSDKLINTPNIDRIAK